MYGPPYIAYRVREYAFYVFFRFQKNVFRPNVFLTSLSANADGPRDAGYRKIDHIALPTEFNYQATSVG